MLVKKSTVLVQFVKLFSNLSYFLFIDQLIIKINLKRIHYFCWLSLKPYEKAYFAEATVETTVDLPRKHQRPKKPTNQVKQTKKKLIVFIFLNFI